MDKKFFLKNTALATISQAGSIITIMVVGIITANYLGPAGKGEANLILPTAMMVGQVLCLGFDIAAPYFLASRRLPHAQVVGAWLITCLLGVILQFGLVYPLMIYFLRDRSFRGISIYLLYLGGLNGLLYLFRLMINTILVGHERFVPLILHNLAMLAANLLTALLALVLCHYQVLGYVYVYLIFGFSSLVFGFIIFIKTVGLKYQFSLKAWWQMFQYGIKASLTQLFQLVDLKLDVYIISAYFSLSDVGIYNVAVGMGAFFWIIPNALSQALLPRAAASDAESAKKFTALSCRNALWQTIIAGSFLLLIRREIIVFIYGKEFNDAAMALLYLMPGVVGLVVSRICLTDCAGRGHPECGTKTSMVTAFLTIFFDLILIPRYSIVGASLASSIAYCTSGVLALYWHIKLSGNSLSQLLLIHREDIIYYRLIIFRLMHKLRGKT